DPPVLHPRGGARDANPGISLVGIDDVACVNGDASSKGADRYRRCGGGGGGGGGGGVGLGEIEGGPGNRRIYGGMARPWGVVVLRLTKIDWLDLQRNIERRCARSARRSALLSQPQRQG